MNIQLNEIEKVPKQTDLLWEMWCDCLLVVGVVELNLSALVMF